ncbi:dihydrofolate reductase family protein [Glacieibacterium frigidum]|uniref:dihydrofolate reductase family protein n=1 Tax=Glacieibacterium frigidum TaxID=2593303 RepID=UPI001F31245A|nr:dihydrofolate reductase family protein [Glacieibacterium frigidum]
MSPSTASCTPGGPTEDPTGGFDDGGWVFKLWDDEVGEAVGSLFSGEYELLLGRRTYDIFAAFWPYVQGEDAVMGEAFTRAGKHVLTHGNQPLEWANRHRLRSIDDVASLKRSDGPDLIIQGSGTIYPGVIAAGLLDRLTLMIFPLTLGNGKRLLGSDTPAGRLRMIDHKITATGVVIATYELCGALPPYPPEVPVPSTSASEEERQRRIVAGTW